MYKRFIEHRVEDALLDTPVVLIAGPRRETTKPLHGTFAGMSSYASEEV